MWRHLMPMTALLVAFTLTSSVLPARAQTSAATHGAPRGQSLCPPGPPAAVVRAYYASLVQHRAAAVRACFAPALTASLPATHTLWSNVVSARVTATRVRPVPPSFVYGRSQPSVRVVKLVQILVSVVMRYRHVDRTAVHNGPNALFFYVGKELPRSPWRIVGVGTGP